MAKPRNWTDDEIRAMGAAYHERKAQAKRKRREARLEREKTQAREEAATRPPSIDTAPPRLRAYATLRADGVSTKDAAKAVGVAEITGKVYNKRIKDLELNDPKRVRRAHTVIDRLMKGKAWGDIKEVKDSTALRAAEAIVDRAEPKVTRSENLNVNASLSPVDLSKYRLGGGGPGVSAGDDDE